MRECDKNTIYIAVEKKRDVTVQGVQRSFSFDEQSVFYYTSSEYFV